MTKLENSYCRPSTEEEHSRFPNLDTESYFGVYHDEKYGLLCLDSTDLNDVEKMSKMREIPVSHFIDLMEDRIVGWRLEEIHGGVSDNGSYYFDFYGNIFEVEDTMIVRMNNRLLYIETFTELLQQLKFIGHETR